MFLIVVLIIHALNILRECIERKVFFKIGDQFKVAFFQFTAEKNDTLKLCGNI